MNRSDLCGALKLVEPAVSTKDFIAIFSCYCFNGKTVLAYDDVVGMQTPCSLDFHGAVRANVLSNFLVASRAKEVKVKEAAGEEAVLGVGRAKLRLTMIPESDFVFSFPAPKESAKASKIKITDKVVRALRLCLISMGTDPSRPSLLGVTVHYNKGALTFYSSDNISAVRVKAKAKVSKEFKPLILSPRFVELLVSSKETPVELELTSGWALARFAEGLELFGRTVSEVDLKALQGMFTGYSSDQRDVYPIPKGLEHALDRALSVLGQTTEKITTVRVAEGKIRLHTESSVGEVNDALTIVEDHPIARLAISPELLKRALGPSESLSFDDRSVLLRGPAFTYLLSAITPDVSE